MYIPDFTFPKSSRLLTSAAFRRVFDNRKSAADSLLVIYAAENDKGKNRLGLSVSKKAGNAVVRNRWKRLIREAFRKNPLESEKNTTGKNTEEKNTAGKNATRKNFDFVVVPKRGAEVPDYAELEKSFCKLVSQIRKGWKE